MDGNQSIRRRWLILPILTVAVHFPVAAGENWIPGPSMLQARTDAAAVVLDHGHVLVMGGIGANGPLASTELFNTEEFFAGPPMFEARSRHAAVKLTDGRVLVTGGVTASGPSAQAEIYNPSTDSWSVAASMIAMRARHTATLLSDGRVLIAGGEGPDSEAVATLEIFDPDNSTFDYAGTLGTPRKGHSATALSDGRVLIAGGSRAGVAFSSSEIYDPATGSITAGPSMTTPRSGHSAMALTSGNVLIAGGSDGSSDLALAELFDAALETFSATGSMATPRTNHVAILLPYNYSVMMVGGLAGGVPAAAAEVFIPWKNSFTPRGSLSFGRVGAVATPIQRGPGVYVGGGSGSATGELRGFATIVTDKLDYAPGEAVAFTGSGWQPGETVTLTLHETPEIHAGRTLTAVADSRGDISNSQFSPESHHVGVSFTVTAVGGDWEAQASFTDTIFSFNILSPTAASPVPLLLPATLSVTLSYHTTAFTTTSCGTHAASTFATISLRDSNAVVVVSTGRIGVPSGNVPSISRALSVPFGLAAGSYGVHVLLQNTRITGSGFFGCSTATVSAVDSEPNSVILVDNQPPAVTVDSASVTVAEGQTAQNQGTYADPNSSDNVQITASVGTVTKTGTNTGVWNWSFSTADGPSESQTVVVDTDDGEGGSGSGAFGLTVNNVPPTASFSTPESADEGSFFTISLANPSDPSPADTAAGFTYAFNCGSGYEGFGASHSTQCTETENRTVEVAGKIRDKDGGETEYKRIVTIDNVAPIVSAGGDSTINEGDPFTRSGSFTDPGADVWSAMVNFGDGSGLQPLTLSGTTFSLNHAYVDNGVYTVTVSVTDDDGGVGTGNLQVTVLNVAPTITDLADAASNEGDPFTRSGSFTDPGADVWSATVNYGDGSGLQPLTLSGTTFSLRHAYVDNGLYTVTVTVADDDGGGGTQSLQVTVGNVAPAITTLALSAGAITEGHTTILTGTFVDPGTADAHGVTITWGDGSAPIVLNLSVGARSFSASHMYADDHPTGTPSDNNTIGVGILDKDGGLGTGATVAVVTNAVPSIISVTGPPEPLAVGSSATIVTRYADAGTEDSHTCSFSWDDGEPDTTSNGSARSCESTRTYAAAGVYTVGVTVTDDDTGVASSTYQFIVVYDSSAGFVTGGGWINSPAGAYRADGSLAGKANFGFVAKYQRGANVPSGQTEFNFKVGNLNFHSTVYEWLVVAGANAQYKGSGTINGTGDYGFLLTATDGDSPGGGGEDKIRIKIVDKTTNEVVYDNRHGDTDDIENANPQAIGGGSIVIHSSP